MEPDFPWMVMYKSEKDGWVIASLVPSLDDAIKSAKWWADRIKTRKYYVVRLDYVVYHKDIDPIVVEEVE